MLPLSFSFLLILASQISVLSALPVLPYPDPSSVQPSVVFPTDAPPETIPAFPEQSAATTAGVATCPLDLSDDLISGVSAACSPRHRLPAFRARCCPTLAIVLYTAYAASTLSAASADSNDLPVLPDDSESCASVAERAIAARGVELPRVNATCGAAYCYCGIRIRRLSCAVTAAGVGPRGRWTPQEELAGRLEKDCARPGLAGCSLCLRTLNQLKHIGGNATSMDGMSGRAHDSDCQLMGLTWLLFRNRTRFLPTSTAVLRALMAAEERASSTSDGGGGPTCHLKRDEMPIAVGSSEIDGGDAEFSPASRMPPAMLLVAFSLLLSGVPSRSMICFCNFGF